MPSSNLAAYLAKNYLTASSVASSDPNKPPKKKRKKSKHQSSDTSLVIADDDEDLHLSNVRNGLNEDEEADTPMMYEGKVRSMNFRKAKKSAWQTLDTSEADASGNSGLVDNSRNSDDADTFLRQTQSEEARRLVERQAEDAPAIVEVQDNEAPRMESGLQAGLQTAADTARLVAAEEAREKAEQKAAKKLRKKKQIEDDGDTVMQTPEEETIYRDATGRRIDISQRRAEARKEQDEKARAKQQEKIDAMGEVQKREREERRRDLEEAKFLTLGRSVEDDECNDRLKDVERWDDPMAAYMAEKRAEEGVAKTKNGKPTGGGDQQMLVVRRKKEYSGPAPPNRYGIKPGWRWDGVDRGNGFEKEWFQARSKRSRNDALSYEWQMDE